MTDHHRSQHRHISLRINSYEPPLHSVNFITGKRLARGIAMVLIGLLTFLAVASGALYMDLANAVKESSVTVIGKGGKVVKTTVDPNEGKALNILVIGQDARAGRNGALINDNNPEDASNHQADTTMVVHISANRKFIDIVSIPRDSLVSVPACTTTAGTIPAQSNIMFNSIFATAYTKANNVSSAASCTMNAVNSLTGLDISQFIVVDFSGMSTMINALGGVDICVPQDFSDSYTNLSLKRGLHHLDGVKATQFARIRHGIGDGSDVMRTVRQQYLIKMLLREATNKNLFTQTNQLYQLAKSAINSLSMSEGLAKVDVLAGLASSLAGLAANSGGHGIYSQTIPVETSTYDPNRVQWTQAASSVWDRLKDDKSLSDDDSAKKPSSSASSSPSESSPSQGDSSSASSPSLPLSPVDPHTGLQKKADGTLIDPGTGGTVDKDSGVINDPATGWYIGFAEKYVNYTFCKIES